MRIVSLIAELFGKFLVSLQRPRSRDDGRASLCQSLGQAASEQWSGTRGDQSDSTLQ
jgi:hypothetical protein